MIPHNRILASTIVVLTLLTGCGNGSEEQKQVQTPYFLVTEIPLKTVTAYTAYPASIEVVPKTATFVRQGGTYIYKVSEDSPATAAQIEIEGEVDNLYIVSSGLEKQERIVSKGVTKINGETKINPQNRLTDRSLEPKVVP